MRYDVGRFRRPMRRSTEGQLMSLISLGDGSTLTLDFTTGQLDPRLTFTRASGGTYTGNDGLVYGMDFATSSSLAIGTGSKSVTLTATANVDRRYLIGQTVWISNGANNMRGPVTAYNASTQVLTINATGTSGSGSFTSWTVGNASARFDHDPTTLAPRGLLIEGSANSLTQSSQDLTNATYWTLQTAYASTSATGGTAPDGTNTGNLFTEPSSNLQRSIYQSYSSAAGTYTFSVWLKAGSGSTRYMRLVVSSGASDFGYVTINMSTGAVQQAATAVGTATNASATVSGNYTATGWRRCSLTITLAASVNFVFLVPIDLASIDTPTTNYGRVSYLGDGSSFLVWGAQLEAGSGASSYIPTGASTVQRLADSCVMTGTNFSSWFAGATEGVLFAECHRPTKIPTPAADHAIVGTRYANGQGLWIYASATNQYPSAYIFPTGGAQFAGGIATQIPLISKQAVRWFDGNDITNFGNGTQGSTNTAGTGTMVPTMLTIGANSTTGTEATIEWFNGCIRRVKFWPTALPNATIQALTT